MTPNPRKNGNVSTCQEHRQSKPRQSSFLGFNKDMGTSESTLVNGQSVHIQSYIIIYTILLFNIAMENGSFIDGLPIKNGDFPWLC